MGRLLRDEGVLSLFLASIPWNMAQTNFFTYLTLFMREAAQVSQQSASVCMALAQGASVVGRLGWGVVSDLLFRGRRKPLVLMLCGSAAVLLALFARVGPGSLAWLGFGLALLLGLTVASFAALVQNLASEAVPAQDSGAAVGVSLVGTSLGGMLGPTFFGVLVDGTGSYPVAWIASAALMGAGTALVAVFVKEGAVR